jgi:hypothetical protein
VLTDIRMGSTLGADRGSNGVPIHSLGPLRGRSDALGPEVRAISGNSSSERATAIADIQIASKMMPTAARASSRRVTSNLSLFRKGKSIIGLDSEVSDKIARHLVRHEGVGAITGDLRRKVKTCVVIRPRSRCLRNALHAIFPLSHAKHRY